MEKYRYKAFISYSHADKKWASWLHRALESYSPPKSLGTDIRLKPIFLDKEELVTSSDLSQSIKTALDQSESLIVICSPGAARSRWVNQEITHFNLRGPTDRIFCLLVGEPKTSFPAALVGNNEPLAADPGNDGKLLAKLKLVAALLNVRLDELRQRESRRRLQRLSMLSGAAVLGMVVTSSLALYAHFSGIVAKRQTAIATAVSDFLREDLLASVAPSTEIGRGKDVLMKDVLDAASRRLENRFAQAPAVEASLRLTLGTTYAALGDYDEAEPHLLSAIELSRALYDPDSTQMFDAEFQLALLRIQQGQHSQAIAMLEALSPDADHLPQARQARLLEALASSYKALDRYAEAKQMLILAVEKSTNANGQVDALTLRLKNSLANVFQEEGDPLKAIELRDHCAAYAQLGEPAALDAIACKNNLANDYALAGKYETSAALQREVYASKIEVYGPLHPKTLSSLHNLGVNEMEIAQFEKAALLFEEVSRLRRQVLGPRHPYAILSSIDHAQALVATRQLEPADTLLNEILPIAAEVLGSEHFDTLRAESYMAWLRCLQGDHELADHMLSSLLERAEHQNARDAEFESSLKALRGIALIEQGRVAEGRKLFAEAEPQLRDSEKAAMRLPSAPSG